jgi:hypothetical protein
MKGQLHQLVSMGHASSCWLVANSRQHPNASPDSLCCIGSIADAVIGPAAVVTLFAVSTSV